MFTLEEAKKELAKTELSIEEFPPSEKLMGDITIGTPRVSFTNGETMLVQVDVSAQNYEVAEVPAVLDGCLITEIFDGEKKVGEAFLNFPRDGVTKEKQTLTGHYLGAKPDVSYKVIIIPKDLWLIEKFEYS